MFVTKAEINSEGFFSVEKCDQSQRRPLNRLVTLWWFGLVSVVHFELFAHAAVNCMQGSSWICTWWWFVLFVSHKVSILRWRTVSKYRYSLTGYLLTPSPLTSSLTLLMSVPATSPNKYTLLHHSAAGGESPAVNFQYCLWPSCPLQWETHFHPSPKQSLVEECQWMCTLAQSALPLCGSLGVVGPI